VSSTRILFGCGYLGLRVGKLWRDAGDEIIAATRSQERAWELRVKHGFRTLVVDVVNLASLADFPRADTLLYAVGFDRNSGDSIQDVYAGGLQNVLATTPSNVRRAIYISTTGVYGPAEGEWVDESTPPDPQRDGGRASLAAELVLAGHHLARHSAILRLAGLYGPDRVPHLDKLRSGEPLPVPADGWLNLIHVDDAARVVVAADAWLAKQPPAEAPHVFCVSDGCPVVRREYYAEVARVLGTPPPRFVAPPADSPAAARAAVSRRVSNRKLRKLLPVSLQYPSYREGLAAILATAP
jgi:nucleoside-diphosphate-sugar epimerase